MSYIHEAARDALQTAGTDLAKARRAFMLVAGVLALIHLLTVYPYLRASQELGEVEKTISDNAALLAEIEPQIQDLQKAGEMAASGLADLLKRATDDMIQRFTDLRGLVERASRGEAIAADTAAEPQGIDAPIQQMAAPPISNMPRMATQQIARPGDDDGHADILPQPTKLVVSPDLKTILDAVAAEEAEAYQRLTDYARENIVAAVYADAEGTWSSTIRPAYVEALRRTEGKAKQAAATASASAMEIAPALAEAADEMARERAVIEAIQIRHDATVDAALGTEWWRTVQGKTRYADAVSESIARQLEEIAATARAPTADIRTALELQERLRAALQSQQQELEKQFADQRDQLAALSGTSGVIPVDLATFIGVFPLVLGLALGFMLLRAGEARRQAAIAAEDLAGYDDQATRVWLMRRALGGGTAFGPLTLTSALVIGTLAWIGLAAMQIAGSPVDPPLTAWTSGGIAILLVLGAAGWDAAAIRRLGTGLER